MGALTGLAALLTAARFPDVDPKAGQGLELKAIAAAVVGGVAISGGRGYLWGVAVRCPPPLIHCASVSVLAFAAASGKRRSRA